MKYWTQFDFLVEQCKNCNDTEKKMIADYVAGRLQQEYGIATNDLDYYRESKSSADNILIALKAMRGTPEDEVFLDAISGDLDTEGADDE